MKKAPAVSHYMPPAERMERIRAIRTAFRQVFSAPVWQPYLPDLDGEWAVRWWMGHGILAIPGSDGVTEEAARDRQAVRSMIARQDWTARTRRKRRISPRLRAVLIKEAEGRCGYCCIPVADGDFVIDHIFPLIRGGRSRLDNLIACCQDCNTEKGAMTPEEWMRHPVIRRASWRCFSKGKYGPEPPPDDAELIMRNGEVCVLVPYKAVT